MAIVHGIDSNSKVVPLLVDSSGRAIVSTAEMTTTGGKLHVDANGDLYITQTDATKMFVTSGGIKKDARGSGIGIAAENTNLSAGTNNLNVAAVPANHKYLIKSISVQYNGTITNVILHIDLIISGVSYRIITFSPIVSARANTLLLEFPLSAGDNIRAIVINATAGDDVYIWVLCEDLE